MQASRPSRGLQEVLRFRDEVEDLVARSRPGDPLYLMLQALGSGARQTAAVLVEDPSSQVTRATLEAWHHCQGSKFAGRLRQLFEHCEKALRLEYPGQALADEAEAVQRDWEEFMRRMFRAGLRITAEDN
jgi:hypothetical protein